MTQEDKQLLLKDLCARLPYGPFVKLMEKFDDEDSEHFREIHNLSTYDIELLNSDEISNIKPYLRPMSSMTEEEMIEFNNIPSTKNYTIIENDLPWDVAHYKQIDWLNKNMFDYRGLIPKGLALSIDELTHIGIKI